MFSCENTRSIISLRAQLGRQRPKRFLQHSSKIKQQEMHCSLIFFSPSHGFLSFFLSFFFPKRTVQLMTKDSLVQRGQAGRRGLLVPGLEMSLTLTSPTRVHQGCPARLLLMQRDFSSLQPSPACQTTLIHIPWGYFPTAASLGSLPTFG